MLAIALRILKDRKKSIIAYGIGMFLIVFMYAAMFPTILEQADKLESIVEIYPEALLEAFGIDDFRFDTIEKFLAVEYYSIVWPIAMIVLVTGLAASFIAREIENGTIEYVLAKPIERWKIFISKYFGGFIVIFIFTLVSVFSVIPSAVIFDIDFNTSAQFMAFFLSLIFALTVYSLAMMFSATFSEKGKVSLAISVIMIAMYVLNIVASIVERVDWLKYVSFFNYYDYDSAIKESTIDVTNLLVFAGVILITTAIGILWFERRDIST